MSNNHALFMSEHNSNINRMLILFQDPCYQPSSMVLACKIHFVCLVISFYHSIQVGFVSCIVSKAYRGFMHRSATFTDMVMHVPWHWFKDLK